MGRDDPIPHVLLDQVCAVFSDCDPVRESLRKLHEQRDSPERVRDNLLSLIKAMANEVGMKLDGFNDDFILRPFSSADDTTDRGTVV